MSNTKIPTVRWDGKDLFILDQTLLPITVKEIKLNTVEEAYNSIKELKVRGAPAIGVAAAYSLLIKLKEKTNLPLHKFARILIASVASVSKDTDIMLNSCTKK